jgi:hypothetical protein
MGIVAVTAVVSASINVALPHIKQALLQRQLYDGRLQAADYWDATPKILSAGLGFTNIIGLPSLDEPTVRAAGGAWAASLTCANETTPAASLRTSAALSSDVSLVYRVTAGATIDHEDGIPIVFSWPVRSNTIDPLDFQFTLNTGQVVYPKAAGIWPNWELDERNTVVVFGHLGNRGVAGEPGAAFPVRLDIVARSSPLMLAGPKGDQAATGLSWTTDHSGYAIGPTLIGAKLNRVDHPAQVEGGIAFAGNDTLPNDEIALYGSAAQYRLRLLTSGGFSPDGVRGLRPTDFARYFRLRGLAPDGRPTFLTQTGVEYHLMGGTVRILGLSDLGKKAGAAPGVNYDDCYAEDRDNYVDVILAGDEAAIRQLAALEMPGLVGGYGALYNPGGPGPTPFPGVRYSAPSPPVIQPITLALDNPMRVSR